MVSCPQVAFSLARRKDKWSSLQLTQGYFLGELDIILGAPEWPGTPRGVPHDLGGVYWLSKCRKGF